METVQPAKRARGRPKSNSEKVSVSEEENPPNVNGEKGEEAMEAAPEKQDEEQEKEVKQKNDDIAEEKPTHGRKRKASEMKSDDSILEEQKAKEGTDENSAKEDSEKNSEVEEEPTSADMSGDLKEDISMPPKQTLGKGKRARIPNKRYSDISITGTPKSEGIKKHVENGDSLGKENDSIENTNSPPSKSKDKDKDTSVITPIVKKQKMTVDLSSPNYLKPFQFGWKRELVYRATSDNNMKRNGDIYYYTPSGKKVRSMREVSENLKNKELTLDDFTFFKEPLGIDDPDKEIIRDAKLKSAIGTVQKKTATPKTPKTPKPSSPKLAPAATTPAADTPKAKTSPRIGGFKVKIPSKGEKATKGKAAKKAKDDEDMEMGMYPPNWTSPAKKHAGKWNNMGEDSKPCRPCSIRCQGVSGLIPTLQCLQCLCLYHNECVGLSPQVNVQGYVCKNCQLDMEQKSGPSASPVSAPPTSTSSTLPQQSLPKLQRMPIPTESKPSPKETSKPMPKLTPKPGMLMTTPKFMKISDITQNPEPKGLVGSVTTWFPPSSTIQVGSDSGTTQVQRPQFVEFVGNKKYLIVPTQNVVAVSPTVAPPAKIFANEASSVTPNVPDSASLGPEGECQIKIEPKDMLPIDEPMEVDSSEPPLLLPAPIPSIPRPVPAAEVSDGGNSLEGLAPNIESETPGKRSSRLSSMKKSEAHSDETKFMDSYLQNLSYGYSALLCVFQYLKVQDLLRAGCVCTMWRDLASHPSLWRTVRMKNSQVHSFEGLAKTLNKHGTVHLDLRKMLLPSNGDDIWPLFSSAIKQVDSLRKIELCRCSASVVEQLAESNPKLQVLNAVTIKCESMSLDPFKNLKDIQELRLKSITGLTLSSDLTALKELQQLKHLSLTSIKDLNKLNIEVIAELTNLESLDFGECADFPKTFGSEILTKLEKLEKLRLERGQGTCYTFEILEAVKNMPKLEQLELVNFDIKAGFDKALGACTNIKKLLIIPTYISQSATTNHMVLGGVLRLQSTLSHFVWGVTLELLRVTELFVDQCEDSDKKDKKDKKPSGNGDSIPVLKPVPLLGESSDSSKVTQDPPQVEILPVPNLQKLLLQNLPTTRVKILKIPFHATWRQSITDSVN